MSPIRRLLGKDFEAMKLDGERSCFAGQFLDSADRDELLAVIGFQSKQHQAERNMRNAHEAFQTEIRKARSV